WKLFNKVFAVIGLAVAVTVSILSAGTVPAILGVAGAVLTVLDTFGIFDRLTKDMSDGQRQDFSVVLGLLTYGLGAASAALGLVAGASLAADMLLDYSSKLITAVIAGTGAMQGVKP